MRSLGQTGEVFADSGTVRIGGNKFGQAPTFGQFNLDIDWIRVY